MRNICLTLILLVFMASCSERKHDYVIAVSSCSDDMWREKLNEEMTLSTYLYDNVRLSIASANDDDKRQIEQIDSFVNAGVDLLIVSPNRMKTISPAINRAYERHIPVVLFDRKTDTNKYTAFIGADNFNVGKDVGAYVVKHMDGRGKIVVVNGLKGSSASIERSEGFMSVINKHKGISVVGVAYADWTQDKARLAMDSLLDSVKDFDLVFAQNDRMALGARQAIEARGLKRNIDYVGIDALPNSGGGMECVSSGVLTATYIYPTRGDLVINLAMNILEGRPYKRENSMAGALVTRDNAGVLLLQNEELTKQRERLYALHDKVDMYLAEYSHQRVYATLAAVIIVLLLISFTMVYRSILERRRMAEREADIKLAFFTNVSHEFRTPLTLIADPIDRLLDDPSLNDGQHSLLKLVRRNVDVMVRLVGEILDFRKVQTGMMKMKLSRFDISEAVGQWIDGFRPAAERKGVSLELSVDGSISIIADYDKVEKTVYNLLSNALKYTPRGGHVCLSVAESEQNVVLKVVDDGQGLTSDEAKHVFDSFYQAQNSIGGTGIGLAIVKAFAEMHRGNVSVESASGQGSTFTVVLPLTQDGEAKDYVPDGRRMPFDGADVGLCADSEDDKRNGIDLMTSVDAEAGQKPQVLVIDDNADVRSYVVSLLSDEYEVHKAADGQSGLSAAMKYVPDVVICDVMMPDIDGLEVCRRLKNDTVTCHIPVLLLTARTLEDQRIEGYGCGADAYITKPFSGKVLTARVRNLLESRRQLKSLYASGDVDDAKRDDADSRFMRDFNRIVMSRLADSSLSVEDVSAQLGLSRVQMYRKVKALTGSTPVELIRIARLKRAERLLKQGGRSVSEISFDVGFSSPSYFAKCFKDYFGRLPSE